MGETMNDRIKLAEARGWDRFYAGDLTGKQYGHPPNGISGQVVPDPFTDANDCEELIQMLSDRFTVVVTHKSERHPAYVELYGPNDQLKNPQHKWYGDNYKQGVCELALTVLP